MRFQSYQHSSFVRAYSVVSLAVFAAVLVLGFVALAAVIAVANLVVLYGGRNGWF